MHVRGGAGGGRGGGGAGSPLRPPGVRGALVTPGTPKGGQGTSLAGSAHPAAASSMLESYVLLNPGAGGARGGLPSTPGRLAAGGGAGTTGGVGDEGAGAAAGDEGGAGGGGAAAAAVQAGAEVAALARLFELASRETGEDLPLCSECSLRLREEVDARLAEAEAEGRAYREALEVLSREDAEEPLPEEEFAAEMIRLRGEEEAERARVAELSAQLEAVRHESAELEGAEKELEALEERLWHDLNAARAEGRDVAEASASLHHRIHVATAQLELLKRSNVYNDAFHIWHTGPFGTISGFRLGRTPEIPVAWEELNAAWGQAVLLLHTMASVEGVHFQECELLPMGSTPRVECRKSRTVYELYGPVTQIVRANYDTGMVLYLRCLEEFETYARGTDLASERRTKPFELPYAIEGDKVNGLTVRLRFNREERWTKALKFMLTNLKVLLAWHTNVRGHGVVARR